MKFPLSKDIEEFVVAYLKGQYFLAKGLAVTMSVRLYGKSYISR